MKTNSKDPEFVSTIFRLPLALFACLLPKGGGRRWFLVARYTQYTIYTYQKKTGHYDPLVSFAYATAYA